ncbi:MAG TPA: PDZ domain-containing protein, partial [Pirellulaceae bacterium]|nr:PDZ domain-containing protein [Pirellulaceae bacterium]
VQWVLHNTPVEGGSLESVVVRSTSEQPIRVTLKLEGGWRRRDDIAWRASSWELRRYALGGLYLKTIDDDLREELEIKPGTMALRAQHVGEYAPHDRAKRAGLRKGDVILSFDGRTDFSRETDLLVYALAQFQSGKSFDIDVLRGGQRLKIQLPAGAK